MTITISQIPRMLLNLGLRSGRVSIENVMSEITIKTCIDTSNNLPEGCSLSSTSRRSRSRKLRDDIEWSIKVLCRQSASVSLCLRVRYINYKVPIGTSESSVRKGSEQVLPYMPGSLHQTERTRHGVSFHRVVLVKISQSFVVTHSAQSLTIIV